MNDTGPPWMDHRDQLYERVVRGGLQKRRRRALTAAAAAVAVIVAVGVGLSLPAGRTRSIHVSNPDRGTTTTTNAGPPARPTGVLLIGDQIMLGAQRELHDDIPGALIDAKVSRQLADVVPTIAAYKQQGTLPQTVVIHLGDNGLLGVDAFDPVSAAVKQIMEIVGSESNVYFVSLKLPRPWEVSTNDALYSVVASFANAHVLDWHDASLSHSYWFTLDGFHLSAAGQIAYAAFVRDGIRPPVTTYADPFAGGAIPATGFVVTDDAKGGAPLPDKAPGAYGPTSFARSLLGDAGHAIGVLPRGTISTDALNAPQHTLVVTDDGIGIEPRPIDDGGDAPAGCTPTGQNDALSVAVCGPGAHEQVLGDHIVVNRGAGWSQLIAKPPVRPGDPLVGHWAWATPSPDGKWVLAGWSAECEVPIGFFISVADGSVHTVTGEAGTAWRDAPESGVIGWAADGTAMAAFGGETACGSSAPAQRGIYLVSPDTGSRRLLLALTPSQGALWWSAVDDRRTRPAG